ncbi:hypothetical protein EJB05_51616, partial [Eragrostis curvula]
MRVQDNFKPRSTDVILATHPKCGTTWLKALAFAITNRSSYTFSDHPLQKKNPQELVPFIGLKEGDVDYAETLPSPRLLSTHLPLPLLPPTVSTFGCRIVYICREPKDAFVSRWHFDNRLIKEIVFDPLKVVRKLASFLGVPFTEEEQSRGVDEEVVRRVHLKCRVTSELEEIRMELESLMHKNLEDLLPRMNSNSLLNVRQQKLNGET